MFDPFELGWPTGMEEALVFTALYEEGELKCSRCGSEKLEKVGDNRVECQNCGAELNIEPSDEDISKLLDVLESDENQRKIKATKQLYSAAVRSPSKLISGKDRLEEMLKEEDPRLMGNALAVISELTKEYPGEFEARPYMELLDHREVVVRQNAAAVLVFIGKEEPNKIESILPKLLDMLDEENPRVRETVSGAIAAYAEGRPEKIKTCIGRIRVLIGDDDKRVKCNAMKIFYHVGKRFPEVLETIEEKIYRMLDDDHEKVRQDATALLIILAEERGLKPEKINQLKSLKDDPDPKVRKNVKTILNKL